MADELRIEGTFRVRDAAFTPAHILELDIPKLDIDIAGTGTTAGVQAIGNAAHEALGVTTDIGTLGYCYFRNLTTSTETIDIGIESGGTFYATVTLKAGEWAVLRAAAALFAKASANTPDLYYVILED